MTLADLWQTLIGFAHTPALLPLLSIGSVSVFYLFRRHIFSNAWDPRGKHCFITGGSSGLGFELALLLAKRGAHISIVARNQERLQKALAQLENARQSPEQIFGAYAFSMSSEVGSAAAIEAASQSFKGRCPDAFFLCAGAARPGYFVEQTEASIRAGMETSYYAQVFTALAATKEMIKQGLKGKIVLCSSILGYFSIAGYTPYTPGKFALRGLADALQSEFMLYGIDVHIAFPGTMYTKGYEEENAHKPKVTLKIEETDSGWPTEVVAAGVLKGVQRGDYHITIGFIGRVFRTSTAGSSPRNSYLLDWVHSLIGYVGLPIWRMTVDHTVIGHRKEHEEYLQKRGIRPS